MLNKKSFAVFTVMLFSFVFSAFVFSGCSGGSDTKNSSSDSSSMQSVPDTSAHTDTTALDTASTRPVKSPN